MIDLVKIDKLIAEKFNLPPLPYSTNRNYSARIVEELRAMSPTIVKEFDKQINVVIENIKRVVGKCTPSDSLLFITSIDICEAALSAIRLCNEKANP